MASFNLRQQALREGPNTILNPLVTGDSTSVSGSPGSTYGNQVYPKVNLANIPPQDFFGGDRESSQYTHDHMAAALGLPCAPAGMKESAANRQFDKAMEAHMQTVHDHHAQKLGLPCASASQQSAPTREHFQVPTNSPRARRTHVQEALLEADWTKLADKSEPLPDGVTYKDLLTHFGRIMVLDYEHKYGAQTVRPRNV